MSSFDPDKNLPGCMMPDGGECCEAYAELYSDWKRLKSGPAPTPGVITTSMVNAALNAWFKSPPSETDQGLERSMKAALEAALAAPTLSPAPVAGLPPSGVEWPEPKVTNPDIANPTGVPYFDCLIHRVLDAQQDINFHANEGMSQSLCEAASLLDEVESVLRKSAALSRVSVEAWQTIESAPKDGAFLVSNASKEVCFADSTDGQRIVHNKPGFADWTGLNPATHWMPLPPPPASGEGR